MHANFIIKVSGLSAWIGEQLAVFGSLPGWLMVAIICFLVAMLTEVTSNSATCTILMPIMASMVMGFLPFIYYLALIVIICKKIKLSLQYLAVETHKKTHNLARFYGTATGLHSFF